MVYSRVLHWIKFIWLGLIDVLFGCVIHGDIKKQRPGYVNKIPCKEGLMVNWFGS